MGCSDKPKEEYIILTPPEVSVDHRGGKVTVFIEANDHLFFGDDPEWSPSVLGVTVGYKRELELNIQPNEGTHERMGTIEISTTSKTAQLLIRQTGKEATDK